MKSNLGSDTINLGKNAYKNSYMEMVYEVDGLTEKTTYSGVLGLA